MERRRKIGTSRLMTCGECGLTTFAPAWDGTLDELRALHKRVCAARDEREEQSA